MTKIRAGILLMLALTSFTIAQKRDSPFIVMKDGKQQSIFSVKMKNDNGDLEVVLKKGSATTMLRKGTYQFAFVPKTQQLDTLSKAMADSNYQEALKIIPNLMASFKYLGWGDYIAACECEANLELGNIEAAKKALAVALCTQGVNKSFVSRAQALCLLKDKKYDKADEILKQLIMSKDDDEAAMAFTLRAKSFEAQGNKKLAVLEYLKLILLFDSKQIGYERKEAKARAITLMKEMNDPRVAKIEAMD